MAQSTPTQCADCGAEQQLLFPWPAPDCPRLMLCSSCDFTRLIELDIEVGNAIAAALECCRWHNYQLTRRLLPESRAR